MASVNKVILVGNLGRDPEMRYMPDGTASASFSIATTEKYKDKGGVQQEHTEWHNISFFGRTAEVCGQYLKKGSAVYVEGSIRSRKYTGKDGVERTAYEIRGDRMQMLGGRAGGGMAEMDDGGTAPAASRPAAPASGQRPAGGRFDDMDDDIPF